MTWNVRIRWISVLVTCALPLSASAQDDDGGFSQWLFTSFKVGSAIGKWRVLGDFQVRIRDDLRELDQWLVEGGVTYSPSEHWEFTPDFRVTVKPARVEYRPGAGVIFKVTPPEWQVALQHKYQLDLESTGRTRQGFRQALFVNHLISPKAFASVIGGWFYESSENFSSIRFWRAGGGVSYIFDPLHTLNVSYFVGWQNLVTEWRLEGFISVGFTINIRTDWRYVPAQIFNF